MKAKKITAAYSIDCRHAFLFKLICKFYGINQSNKLDELIKSFNEIYANDFLNKSRIGRYIAAVCSKPWAISWGEGKEGGNPIPAERLSLANIDLDKLFLFKDDIMKFYEQDKPIEKFRPQTMKNMTNLFEGSVKWEEK